MALGFAGVAVVIGLDALGGFDLRSLAQLAMLASTLSYAAVRRLGPRAGWATCARRWPPLGMLTGSTLILLPLSWALEGPLPLCPARRHAGAPSAIYALVVTALAYLLYYRIIRLAGAGNTDAGDAADRARSRSTLGALVRAEAPAASAYVGFGLIALGLVVIDGRLLRGAARRV